MLLSFPYKLDLFQNRRVTVAAKYMIAFLPSDNEENIMAIVAKIQTQGFILSFLDQNQYCLKKTNKLSAVLSCGSIQIHYSDLSYVYCLPLVLYSRSVSDTSWSSKTGFCELAFSDEDLRSSGWASHFTIFYTLGPLVSVRLPQVSLEEFL